ncbi:MAG: DNA polymerase III subunit gamma/tau [Candidatus Andersenbacteria bacterium]
MPTLYRQYRPQKFEELYGQEHIVSSLQQAILKQRIAHAYLFYGPRGTGKTTTARILAKRLNCTQADGTEPCGQCPLCLATQQQQNIDIIEIDAASNRGIDDIRALKEGIALAPAMGAYKVYIIDEVHMLTNEAFTALLKTLEEPVKHAIFILATTELQKVPETILSRCQIFRFRRATSEELKRRLTYLLEQEKRPVDEAAIDFIINRSDGCFRDAESLLGQILTLHDGPIILDNLTQFLGLPPPQLIDDFLASLVRGESAPAVVVLDQAFADGFDPEQLLKESITRARDGALAILKKEKSLPPFAQELGARERLPSIIRALLQALQDLAYVPQPLIALHLSILTLCTTKGTAPGTSLQPQPSNVATPKPEAMPVPQKIIAHSSNKAATVSAADSAVTGVTLEQVRSVWPQIIEIVKTKNPVAGTFLRAIQPVDITGTTVRLQANYALHRNFFDKPDNQTLVRQSLSQLLRVEIGVTCFLQGEAITKASWSPAKPQAEQDLLAAVKEVFGQPQ